MQTLADQIMKRASTLPEGAPIAAKGLLHPGSRAAVDQALSRLVRRGRLLRAGRGVYLRPIASRFGTRTPSVEQAVEALATQKGEVIGRHDGLMYYTIGQRKGLGIGGRGDGRSWFVSGKDLKNNVLQVVQGEDHPSLFQHEAKLNQITWVGDDPQEKEFEIMVKVRYRQKDQPAKLVLDGDEGTLLFDTPQRAVTPGQSAVFYQGEVCLGGGIIL